METAALCSPQCEKGEHVQGVQSGEIFVRVNRSLDLLLKPTASARSGTLHGARPFAQALLGLDGDVAISAERELAQQWSAKVDHARGLRRQLKTRRDALRDEIQWIHTSIDDVVAPARLGVFASDDQRAFQRQGCAAAWQKYMITFEDMEKTLQQHVAADVVRLYALLDAESDFIREWLAKEEAQCAALKQQTRLLYRLNLFAMQLEDETSGQVRMRRLPLEDAQRRRCVKAASENVKRAVLDGRSVDVMEVYKVENRALLDIFQRHVTDLPPSLRPKIKGLFCSVPPESVERCVAFGMHSEQDVLDNSEAIGHFRLFNRALPGSDDRDAPGTSHTLRARSQALESSSLDFPRRFSRYSTFEEARASSSEASGPGEFSSPPADGSIKYLMLCRVAMGKTERATVSSRFSTAALLSSLANYDSLVGTLLIPGEEEYFVRYPQAVVPEFLLQYRLVPSTAAKSTTPASRQILSVDLTKSTPDLASKAFRELLAAQSSLPATAISAFPLNLRDGPVDNVFSKSSPPRQLEQTKRERDYDGPSRPDIVLDNCARQKTRLREDLETLHDVFWAGARDLWVRAEREQRQPEPHSRADESVSKATLFAGMLPVSSTHDLKHVPH